MTVTCTCRGPNDNSLYLDLNTRIQIIDTIGLLPEAEKDQCGAFIVSEFAQPPYCLFVAKKKISEMNAPLFYGVTASKISCLSVKNSKKK